MSTEKPHTELQPQPGSSQPPEQAPEHFHDDSVARNKSGEGAQSALALLKRRLQSRGLLNPGAESEHEPGN